MTISDIKLQEWASPPPRENDLSAKTYDFLKQKLIDKFGNKVDIFLQGSYANSTNIKKDSDIDIVLCYKESFFFDILSLNQQEQDIFHKNTSTATYTFSEFKNDVEKYLRNIFGERIERKDKCIRIEGNGHYVDADIIPCFVHKRYSSPNIVEAEGIQFKSDKGENIISFPKQHQRNGEFKNTNTYTKYKAVVRILKNCKKLLIDQKIIEEKLISSFFIECLVWNVPNSYFINQTGYLNITNSIIKKIYSDMKDESVKYAEINNLFWLFLRSTIKKEDVMKFLEKVYSLLNP